MADGGPPTCWVCGILIEMAEPFFSCSWRIVGPHGRAVQQERGRLQHRTYDARSSERGARRALEHEPKSCSDTDECCTAGPLECVVHLPLTGEQLTATPHPARRPTETREVRRTAVQALPETVAQGRDSKYRTA